MLRNTKTKWGRWIALVVVGTMWFEPALGEHRLSVGGSVVDVTPRDLPISVTGSISVKYADRIVDSLSVRSLVVSDSQRSVAFCVVDNCTIPQSMVDSAIASIVKQTDLTSAGIIIAATHTHSAPAVMALHGNDRDDAYAEFLEASIVKSIVSASKNQQPAQVGYATVELPKWTHVRRWLMKDGTAQGHPFTGRDGNRVQFNPGHGNPNKIRAVGKPDARLTLLAFQSLDGRPIAAMTNYNTHYAGAPQISADYFGVVGRGLGKAIGARDDFVALASNGNSGNVNCIDFSQPQRAKFTHHDVGRDVIEAATRAYNSIDNFRSDVTVDYTKSTVPLSIRKASEAEVQRARQATAAWYNERGPKGWVESYARETIKLTEYPDHMDLPLRSVRIGEFGIGSIPCEVYAETGVSIKDHSPFAETIVMGWAGGYWGYLPTPEAFRLGGYTTWRCRSSCLEVMAEPKISAEIDNQLLELSRRQDQQAMAAPATNAAMVSADGLIVEQVAAEPLIVDPVAVRFDREGRMWVVEMRDYPVPTPGKEPAGRIRILTDQDGDGFYESAGTYVDGLDFPTGIQPWRDGVIVTLAGRVEFMRDRDQDGECDEREVWLAGFEEDNEQLRANHPTLAADGWIYVANGLRGGIVRGVGEGWVGQPDVNLKGCDLAFHPKEKRFKAVAGNSQYGLTIDDFGQRYGVSNRTPIQAATWSVALLRNDPWNGPAAAVSLYAASGAESEVRPLVSTSTTSHLHAGQYSAACGVHQIDSIAMGNWNGSVLVCEPTGYLVQRLSPKFASNQAPWFEPVFNPGDAIVSTNRFFRPVNLAAGPGGVYLVDMQRQIIEHPQWMPAELNERDDFKVGEDRGRVYRLTHASIDEPVAKVDWDDATPRGWIERLNHADGWLRGEAVRQWLEASSPPVGWTDWLRSAELNPATQAIVLRWLASEGELSDQDIERPMASVDPRLRQSLASMLDPAKHPAWLVELLDDPDASVRKSALQSAFEASEEWNESFCDSVMQAVISMHDVEAGLPSLATASLANQRHLAEALIEKPWDPAHASLVHQATRLLAFRSDGIELTKRIVSSIDVDNAATSMRALTILAAIIEADRLKRRSTLKTMLLDRNVQTQLNEIAESSAGSDSVVAAHALTWIAYRPEQHVQWLRQTRGAGGGNAFATAVRCLANLHPNEHASWCRMNASELPMAELQTVVDAAILSDAGRKWFSDGIDKGDLPVMLASDIRWKQVLQTEDADIRQAARRVQTSLRDRKQNRLEKFVNSIEGPGDLMSGRELFRKQCSVCHVMEGFGTQVGPDISDSRRKSKRYLLEAIVDPSASIDAGYVGHQVLTLDGEIVQGLVVAQSDQTITLQTSGGIQRSFATDELEISQAQTTSLMPEGFDSAMTPTQMNDLLHYIKSWRGDTYTK